MDLVFDIKKSTKDKVHVYSKFSRYSEIVKFETFDVRKSIIKDLKLVEDTEQFSGFDSVPTSTVLSRWNDFYTTMDRPYGLIFFESKKDADNMVYDVEVLTEKLDVFRYDRNVQFANLTKRIKVI